ncbi:MAG: hypothetical protein ACX939_05825, partial [Hyphococcus sp.]
MFRFFLIAFACCLTGVASAQPDTAMSAEKGVALYRAGLKDAAHDLLLPAAYAGDPKAKRYAAYMLLDYGARFDPESGVEMLFE